MSKCWPLQMPPTPKSVLISLADNANDHGVCWPSIATIAKRTCFSERAVQDAIKWLEKHGIAKADRSNGRHTTYLIEPEKYVEPTQEPHPRSSRTPAADAPTPAAAASVPQQMPRQPPQEVPSNRKEPSKEPSGNRQTRVKQETIDTFVLPDWIPEDAWIGYIEMRQKKKQAPTERARDLVIKELTKLRGLGQDVEAVLNQSTRVGWTDVYAVKAVNQPHMISEQAREAKRLADNEEVKRILFGSKHAEVIDV